MRDHRWLVVAVGVLVVVAIHAILFALAIPLAHLSAAAAAVVVVVVLVEHLGLLGPGAAGLHRRRRGDPDA